MGSVLVRHAEMEIWYVKGMYMLKVVSKFRVELHVNIQLTL